MPGHPEYLGDPFDHLNFSSEARVPDFALRYWGVVPALVTNNKDPDGHGRIKVRFPWLTPEDETDWIRMATLMAGMKRGTYFLPEVGDEVLIAFEQGEVHRPLCIGALWNGEDPSPHTNADGKNDIRLIKSRSGHKLIFDDKDGEERITFVDKTGKNRIVWEVKEKAITVQSLEGHIAVKAPQGTLKINVGTLDVKTSSETVLASDGTVEISSAAKMEWSAGGDTTITGSLLNVNVSGPAGGGGNASGGKATDTPGPGSGGGGGGAAAQQESSAAGSGDGAGKEDKPAEAKPPPVVVSAAWKEGEAVLGVGGATLSAQVGNIDDGTSASFEIKDRDGKSIKTVTGTVSGGKATAQWTPELPDGSPPEFQFEVTAQGKSSKSGILKLVTWVDLTITDPDGKKLPGAEYEITLDDGSRQKGKADRDGHVRHEKVYPGKVKAVRVFWKEGMTADGADGAGGAGAGGDGAAGGAGTDAAATEEGDVHVVAVTVHTIGDTPLLSHPVKILDPDSGKVVAETETDDKGVVHAEVPEAKTYRIEIVDDAMEHAFLPPPIPEEPLGTLVCEFLDEAGKPLANEKVDLAGDADLTTDEKGRIEAPAPLGPVELKVKGQTFVAHALPTEDAKKDENLYVFLVTAK